MGRKFAELMKEIEDEAAAAGPEAVAELNALHEHYRVGAQLAEARLKKKLSQAEVARRANVEQAAVSRIERGQANPTFATLSAVAAAVGLEVALRPNRRT